jgi:hypothetical protein
MNFIISFYKTERKSNPSISWIACKQRYFGQHSQ